MAEEGFPNSPDEVLSGTQKSPVKTAVTGQHQRTSALGQFPVAHHCELGSRNAVSGSPGPIRN
jgi:hypothetical protein